MAGSICNAFTHCSNPDGCANGVDSTAVDYQTCYLGLSYSVAYEDRIPDVIFGSAAATTLGSGEQF